MSRLVMVFVVLIISLAVAIGVLWKEQASFVVSPIGKLMEKPLDKYTIENLSKRQSVGSQIVLDEAVATTSAYTVYQFHFTTADPTSSLDKSSGLRGAVKKMTGLALVPHSDSGNQYIKQYPVIVQFRGYVDREKYSPGEGTRHSSEVFAQHGFLTLAPDFLGYGGSASPSADALEERFQTYTTALDLIASVKTLPMADPDNIGIWGHSNGGQIALTVLEILHTPIPASLWAPVSKPFPYSILYYTDDALDRGKLLRRLLAKFEDNYDVELYSLTNYLDRLAGPMLMHQGGSDDAVPQAWSDQFVKKLKEQEKDVTYYIYPGADHNMSPDAWNTVVLRDVAFFQKWLKSGL
ncbi:hypothetical protein A2Z00_01915 [Candidatus Gottesmanbacteria bacterium RBG_13_45_10]|uniref:Peptidase S9 prolyl oligopeptidase catalytic domain-containing protein n=1 Tax=Candidatus Gottesmanbacteria bacterium RBG_13_45_10 TaxID=1798370 RepID=A0A1F5ZI56_9BACT|nr:MAG: hypothetical protein A2Z00_01915 [Candidatus Gottesmanbacteria bacterium RBG_13_45_10]